MRRRSHSYHKYHPFDFLFPTYVGVICNPSTKPTPNAKITPGADLQRPVPGILFFRALPGFGTGPLFGPSVGQLKMDVAGGINEYMEAVDLAAEDGLFGFV